MTTFIDALPEGYDDRTRLALWDDNQIVATHPEHPALLLSGGHWRGIGSERPRQAADAAITLLWPEPQP